MYQIHSIFGDDNRQRWRNLFHAFPMTNGKMKRISQQTTERNQSHQSIVTTIHSPGTSNIEDSFNPWQGPTNYALLLNVHRHRETFKSHESLARARVAIPIYVDSVMC